MRLATLLPVTLIIFRQSCSKPTKMELLRQLQTLPWCKPDWCFPSMSKETYELLRQCQHTPDMDAVGVEDVLEASQRFPVKFPIDSVRLHKLMESQPKETLQRNIESTYPLIHERVLLLMTHFLLYKREFGSPIEKNLYKDMSIPEFIDRLLQKRAISFYGAIDRYTLITGEKGEDGWESVGSVNQKPPLTLDKCLSYDEIKIAALVYVSGQTVFVNDGARDNVGVVQESGVERHGVIIGLVGPRLERKQRMDYEDLVLTEQQNAIENGYGEEVTPTTCLNVLKTTYVRNNQSTKHMWRQMWSEFYQVHSKTYAELQSSTELFDSKDEIQKYKDRYVKLYGDVVFDNEVYYKRLSVSFECALLEANERGKVAGKMVFFNIVGIGLGVWRVSTHQTDVFVLTLLERMRTFLRRELLNHVSDVNFAYITPSESIVALFKKSNEQNATVNDKNIFFESKKHPNGGINVQIQNRNPSAELTATEAGKFLVTTYAWDGNAHPGNEFWDGSLKSSGDPAAACSSQVAELHNAHINPYVSAKNTKIVTSNGLVHLKEYVKRIDD